MPYLAVGALQTAARARRAGEPRRFAEAFAELAGATRALPLGMYDIDAIEAINFEQLATATDRLLLRGRHTRRRPSTNKIVYRPAFRVELAEERTVIAPPELAPEQTLFVRARTLSTSTASAAVVATVFAIGLAVTSLL